MVIKMFLKLQKIIRSIPIVCYCQNIIYNSVHKKNINTDPPTLFVLTPLL